MGPLASPCMRIHLESRCEAAESVDQCTEDRNSAMGWGARAPRGGPGLGLRRGSCTFIKGRVGARTDLWALMTSNVGMVC